MIWGRHGKLTKSNIIPGRNSAKRPLCPFSASEELTGHHYLRRLRKSPASHIYITPQYYHF
ncbi:hypothetical protein DCAR_0729985 [Daucus carota subsp. sativus]|uniref:Uncharacterized protein n=1 Tax=Daucus carota subsp. sativus TaxID=79200 RepID=A0A161ZR80_DAUCS|nr:hypothetical protein DCAR_0729985 [Daucus carota subsp. sativus]